MWNENDMQMKIKFLRQKDFAKCRATVGVPRSCLHRRQHYRLHTTLNWLMSGRPVYLLISLMSSPRLEVRILTGYTIPLY